MRDLPTKKVLPAEEEWPHTEGWTLESVSYNTALPVWDWNCVNNNDKDAEKLHFTLPSYQCPNRWVVATWPKRTSHYKSTITIKSRHSITKSEGPFAVSSFKYEDFLFFLMLHDSKLNIFQLWTAFLDQTSNLKTSSSNLDTCDYHSITFWHFMEHLLD